jgi:hypothetical protein
VEGDGLGEELGFGGHWGILTRAEFGGTASCLPRIARTSRRCTWRV